jgi:hypothetical protein
MVEHLFELLIFIQVISKISVLKNTIIRVIKSRKLKWRHRVRMAKKRNAYKISVGEPKTKRPVGIYRC